MQHVATAQVARRLVFAFLAVVLAFVGSTVYGEITASEAHRHARVVLDRELPGVEHLTTVRAELREVETLVAHLVDDEHADVALGQAHARAALARLAAAFETYVALPPLPNGSERFEARAREALAPDVAGERLASLHELATRTLAQLAGADRSAARATFDEGLRPTIARIDADVLLLTRVSAASAHDLVTRMTDAQRRATRISVTLDVVAALLAIAVAVATLRTFRRYTQLVSAHDRMLEQRAEELEGFAGRVAHDVVSPLSAVAVALAFARRSVDEKAGQMIDRGLGALGRVRAIVDALLDFARSGARPQGSEASDLRAVAAEVLDDVRVAGGAEGFDFELDVPGDASVACARGVLASIVSNLLTNAVRYTRESPVRRVVVRAHERGHCVRCEVKDTGPGLPPGEAETVFLPYVRGTGAPRGGIGLGLATVKRLVEAHDGRLGVRSVFGEGCTFWFELPKAHRP